MVVECVKVATTLEVPSGVTRMVAVAGQAVCLASVHSKCYAVGNVFTREEGPLDHGRLKESEIYNAFLYKRGPNLVGFEYV